LGKDTVVVLVAGARVVVVTVVAATSDAWEGEDDALVPAVKYPAVSAPNTTNVPKAILSRVPRRWRARSTELDIGTDELLDS